MTIYRWRSGEWRDRDGLPLLNQEESARPIAAPMVMRDTPDYESPVTGEMITSRSHRREDLKRHDCHEVDPPKTVTLKNERFCKKWGLPLGETKTAKMKEILRARP